MLYHTSPGNINIGDMTFTLHSELTETFTLTCISTGAPVNVVTWTRDSVTIINSVTTRYILTNRSVAQYNHSLTVRGRKEGIYSCNISDISGQSHAVKLNVKAPSPPSGMKVSQTGFDSLLVSWRSEAGDVIGYNISYYGDQNGSEWVGNSATSVTITELTNGETYSIFIVAISTTLPSAATTLTHTLGKWLQSSLCRFFKLIITSFHLP
jgi:hypothetical protein